MSMVLVPANRSMVLETTDQSQTWKQSLQRKVTSTMYQSPTGWVTFTIIVQHFGTIDTLIHGYLLNGTRWTLPQACDQTHN